MLRTWRHRLTDFCFATVVRAYGRLFGAREEDYAGENYRYQIKDAPLPMLMVSKEGTIEATNGLLDQLFGYAPGELVGQQLEVLIPQSLRQGHVALRSGYIRKPHPQPMSDRDLHGQHKDGSLIPIEVGLSAIRTRNGMAAIATVIDISEKRRSQQQLVQTSNLMSSIIHSAPFSIIATDLEGRIISVSPATEQMLRYRQDELVGQHTPEIIHDAQEVATRAEELSIELGETVAPGFEVFVAKSKRGIAESREWTYIRKDGSRVPVNLTVSALRNPEQEVVGFLGIAFDISERKRADDYIRFLAHHDVLTGLPNRTLLQDRLDVAIERARRFSQRIGIMMVDLDHFKRINDSLGHHTGDQLLVVIAQRLGNCVRTTDTVARMGGDEFVIVLPDINDRHEVEHIADKIVRNISRPVAIGAHSLRVTPSIGACVYPDDGDNASALLKGADIAMYDAKACGRANVRVFSIDMARAAAERLELEHALRDAIDREEFVLYYQPQLSLHDETIIGMEALLRWQHPQRGLLTPDKFIGVAEDSALIGPIGEWVLREACHEARRMAELAGQPLVMAVNMSPHQLSQQSIAEFVDGTLRECGLDAAALEIEITENVLISHAEETRTQLEKIRALGVRIAIDDFGTGFSSLSYITRFPIDRIKIDQSFVRNLARDSSSEAVVNAIISMASGLDLDVTAEGVETVAQRNYLKARHCGSAQGYLYARPMPAEAAIAFLLEHSAGVTVD